MGKMRSRMEITYQWSAIEDSEINAGLSLEWNLLRASYKESMVSRYLR
jgi:hypothetical protein